jgi:hypothetical protein
MIYLRNELTKNTSKKKFPEKKEINNTNYHY